MITENKEKKNAWIVKRAENITSNIQVEFFQTYEDAYAFMEKEARSRDGKLSFDEMGASVFYTNGDYEYWGIEEIDVTHGLNKGNTRTEQNVSECWDDKKQEFDWDEYQYLCDCADYWDSED